MRRALISVLVMLAATAVLAATAGLAALPASASAAGGTAGSAACPRVLFVGVRGSGQLASDDDGYGDAVEAVRDGFVAGLPPGVSYQSVALRYPAAPVPLASASKAAWQRLLTSITDGTRALHRVLATSQRTCTGARAQRWVVVGYSQGALVVNQAVRDFPAAHFAQVDLIGDPARVPGQVGIQTGSAQPGYGVAALIRITRQTGPLPAGFAPVTSSLCDDDDLICDYSNLRTAAQASYGATVHTTYAARDGSTLHWMGLQAGDDADGAIARRYSPRLATAAALGSLTPGRAIPSTITGYAPGEAVQVVLESTPRVLGTVRASGQGVVQYTLTVPAALSRGEHHLVFVSGTGAVTRTFWIGPVVAPSPAPAASPPPAAQGPPPVRQVGSDHAGLIAAIAAAAAVAVAAAGAYLGWRHRRARS